MKFDRFHLIGFGKFTDFELRLKPGLNVIYGPNEAGKSTLLAFIEMMLYGAKKDGLNRSYYLPVYDAYKPWSGASYEGRMEMNLDDGRRIEVYRRFDRDRESITLHDLNLGKDLTSQFNSDQRGEKLFALKLLGMTRAVFTGTTYIPQMGLVDGFGDGTNELGSFLVKSLGRSSRDASSSRAQARLNDALAAIGKTDRGKRSGELKSAIEALGDELTQARAHRAELTTHKERFRHVEHEHSLALNLVEQLQRNHAKTRIASLERDIARINDLNEKIDQERVKVGEYNEFRDFKSEDVERIKSLAVDRDKNSERVAELKQKVDSLEGEMTELQEKFKPYRAFKNLEEGADRKIVELKTRWLAAEDNVRNVGAQVVGEQDKLRTRQARLAELGDLFSALGPDAGKRLEEITTEEEQVQEKLSKLERYVDVEVQREKPQRALAAGAAILSFLFAFGGLIADLLETFSIASTRSFWMPMVIVAGAFLLTAILLRHRSHIVTSGVKKSSDEYTSLFNLRRDLGKERATILSLAGVKTISEFHKLSAEYGVLQAEFTDNTILLQQKRLPKLEDEAQQLKEQILALLRHVGFAGETDVPEESDIQRYISGYQKARELGAAFTSCKERYNELGIDLKKCLDEKTIIEREMADLYRGAEARNFTEFMRKSENKKSYDNHSATLERYLEKRDDILDDRDLEDLKAELERLSSISGGAVQAEKEASHKAVDEEELNRAKRHLADVQSELDTLRGTIEQMERDQRDPGMIEFELEQYRDELARIDQRRKALTIALEMLDEATESLHADIAPLLNDAIGRVAEMITAGRYGDVMIDEGLGISVRVPENGSIVDVEQLSSGARDQLFFAARIALADALTKENEKVPLILDDSLVEYDRERAGETVRLVAKIAEDRQVILMTCHQREVELAKEICSEKFTLINLGGES